VEGLECTINVYYDSPLWYTLVDTFMNDSESISDKDYTQDIQLYPELCIRGRLSLSSAFIPSIEVSIYPSSEAATPFLESELSSIGVRMQMESRDRVSFGEVLYAFAERLDSAARHAMLEALDETNGVSELEPIVYPEPALPPGWERRLLDADKSYFIHPHSGQTSPLPPPFEPMPDSTGEFYYLIFAFLLIVL
jgi:hypothetical protein